MSKKLLEIDLDEDEYLRLSLERILKVYQNKDSTHQDLEITFEMICVFLFNRDEELMDKFIKEIKDEDSRFWLLWPDFEGDRGQLVRMLEIAKLYLEGGAKELFAKYILKILECEELGSQYRRLRLESDQIADKLEKVLQNHREPNGEKNFSIDRMTSDLQFSKLGRWFSFWNSPGYDKIYSILEENVPMIFPDKERLVASIMKAHQKNPRKVNKENLKRFINYLRGWYE